jgi:hypothetical protein
MHYEQIEYMHCAGRLIPPSSFLAETLQTTSFHTSRQMHSKHSEYIHCDGKVSPFQRLPGRCFASYLSTCTAHVRVVPFILPGRCMASNLNTYTAPARLVPFRGFLAVALQAREYMHCTCKDSSFHTSWQMHGKQSEYIHCAGKV